MCGGGRRAAEWGRLIMNSIISCAKLVAVHMSLVCMIGYMVPTVRASERVGNSVIVDCISVNQKRNFFNQIGDTIDDIPILTFFVKKTKVNKKLGDEEVRKHLSDLVASVISDHFGSEVSTKTACGKQGDMNASLIISGDVQHFLSLTDRQHAADHLEGEKIDQYKADYQRLDREQSVHLDEKTRDQFVRVKLTLEIPGHSASYLLAQAEGKLERTVDIVALAGHDVAELLTYAFKPFQGETLVQTIKRLDGDREATIDQIRAILAAGLDNELDGIEAAARARTFFQLFEQIDGSATPSQSLLLKHYEAVLQVLYQDLPKALEIFEPIAAKIETSSDFYMLVGERFAADEKWQDALDAFHQAYKWNEANRAILLKIAETQYTLDSDSQRDPLVAPMKLQAGYAKYIEQDPCDARLHYEVLERMDSRFGAKEAISAAEKFYELCRAVDPNGFSGESLTASVRMGMFASEHERFDIAKSIFEAAREKAQNITPERYRKALTAFIDYRLAQLLSEIQWTDGYNLQASAAAYQRVLKQHIDVGDVDITDFHTANKYCPAANPAVFDAVTTTITLMNLIEIQAVRGDIEPARKNLFVLERFLFPPSDIDGCADADRQQDRPGIRESFDYLYLLVDTLEGRSTGGVAAYVARFGKLQSDLSPIWNYDLADFELENYHDEVCRQGGVQCDSVIKAQKLTACFRAIDELALQLNLSRKSLAEKPDLPSVCLPFQSVNPIIAASGQ